MLVLFRPPSPPYIRFIATPPTVPLRFLYNYVPRYSVHDRRPSKPPRRLGPRYNLISLRAAFRNSVAWQPVDWQMAFRNFQTILYIIRTRIHNNTIIILYGLSAAAATVVLVVLVVVLVARAKQCSGSATQKRRRAYITIDRLRVSKTSLRIRLVPAPRQPEQGSRVSSGFTPYGADNSDGTSLLFLPDPD